MRVFHSNHKYVRLRRCDSIQNYRRRLSERGRRPRGPGLSQVLIPLTIFNPYRCHQYLLSTCWNLFSRRNTRKHSKFKYTVKFVHKSISETYNSFFCLDRKARRKKAASYVISVRGFSATNGIGVRFAQYDSPTSTEQIYRLRNPFLTGVDIELCPATLLGSAVCWTHPIV